MEGRKRSRYREIGTEERIEEGKEGEEKINELGKEEGKIK